jgi:hypothetical protein
LRTNSDSPAASERTMRPKKHETTAKKICSGARLDACRDPWAQSKGYPLGQNRNSPLIGYDTRSPNRALRMAAPIQPQHDLSPIKIDAIEDWIYKYNCRAIGCNVARGLGFVIRDEAGRTIGVAAGYSWAGTSELKQMWVDEAYYTRLPHCRGRVFNCAAWKPSGQRRGGH